LRSGFKSEQFDALVVEKKRAAAEARLKKKEERDAESQKDIGQYEHARLTVIDRTTRLRAERLIREEAVSAIKRATAKTSRKNAIKKITKARAATE
jgi:hypothetical protein